jgi:hypothetical protein
MIMTLKEYLDSKRKEQINKKENRPMKVKVKEIIEYYTRFDKDERDTEDQFNDEQKIRLYISEYVDENWND